jgi:hypothetical protein
MTLFGNTVRAVIATLSVVSALLCAGALAYWLSAEAFGADLRRTRWDDAAWVVLASLTVLFALVQSFIQFRRLQTSSRTIIKYSIALIAFTFFETLCWLSLPPFFLTLQTKFAFVPTA